MRHGSLFSGIGGFDLASEWMGWENVFHCEWNEFGKKVLKYYWPKAISYDDITKADFTIHRGTIDILTGGFPCQPYSSAGKRLGKEDERHLWPEMLRAIKEIQPRWVVGENVFGLINWSGGLVFHEVQTDLEAAGYEVWPYVLPAVSVNAPHRRDRVWFVATYTMCQRYSKPTGREDNYEEWKDGKEKQGIRNRIRTKVSRYSQVASDTCDKRLQGSKLDESFGRKERNGDESYGSTSQLFEIPHWRSFPTQSPICSGDDGLPTKLDGITFSKWRNESIKAYGNAIVPQVVYQIFNTIEAYEESRK